jgi:glycosyltransferase involved in cell wall biosynthesis
MIYDRNAQFARDEDISGGSTAKVGEAYDQQALGEGGPSTRGPRLGSRPHTDHTVTPEDTVTPDNPRALVYGDVDLNVIDGSAIWAQSTTQALAEAGCRTTLLLKAPVRTDRLIAPLLDEPRIEVRRPFEEKLTVHPDTRGLAPEEAVRIMTALDDEARFDVVVVRGLALAARAAREEKLRGRLWTYLTDVPQHVAELTPDAVGRLTEIALASRFLLCQTEELRSFLESTVPAACGRCVLFPPVVVVPEIPERSGPHERETLALVYTGKFAPRWNTREMTRLPSVLAERGIAAELHMVGDKIHREDPDWARDMERALRATPGVVWHGGMARAEALRLASSCDAGLSWRSTELDGSLELSTKVLELGALGLPVLLNRTPMHERLLGEDYPLFTDSHAESVVDAVARLHSGSAGGAAERCRAAAQDFTLQRAAERLRSCLRRALPPAPRLGGRPLRVVIAGHDLKFFTRLGEYLASLPGLEVRLDEWDGLDLHDPEVSRELASWADVVICEWCGPNALFYSRHKRPDQRLIVRLHRFELYSEWPRRLDIDRVDTVVCVSPHYAELTRRQTGWPTDKIRVVPNWVDVEQLDRPKLADARFTVGMIGTVPCRKRLDRALDVLAALRRRDPRYGLAVKSKHPWEYWWVWEKPEEREFFERTYRRIQRSPELADAVVFDSHGPDVAAWLRRVGFVLSTSDDESFHLAPAEGAASGAVPVLLEWPGADTIYESRWIHADPEAMAEAVHRIVDGGAFDVERRAAQAEITARYDLPRVRRRWTELVTGQAVDDDPAPDDPPSGVLRTLS